MQQVDISITRAILKKMSEKMFEDLVKAVVDVEKKIMYVDAQMHADMEKVMLEQGSDQKDLWGINLYPDDTEDSWIEFDSLINLRPSWGNKTRGVDDREVQKQIRDIVDNLVVK